MINTNLKQMGFGIKSSLHYLVEKNIRIIGLVILFLSLYFVSKPIFLLSLFIGFDLVNIFIKRSFKLYVPVDFIVVGSIILSYLFGIKYGLIVSVFLVINRLIMGTVEFRHIMKLLPIVIVVLLSSLLSKYSFVLVGISLFILRYVIENIMEYVLFGKLSLAVKIERFVHILAVYVFLIMFNSTFLFFF